MKRIILTLGIVLATLCSFSQHSPDFERIEFEPDSIVTVLPPVDADNDSTGFVFFDFNKELPYSKYINGEKVWITSIEQGKEYVEFDEDEEFPVLKEVHGQKILVMDVNQARQIAADIANYSVMDSILVAYDFRDALNAQIILDQETIISELERTIENKDNIISDKDGIIANKDEALGTKDEQIEDLEADIKAKKKALNRQKWITAGSAAITVIVVIAALL